MEYYGGPRGPEKAIKASIAGLRVAMVAGNTPRADPFRLRISIYEIPSSCILADI